MIPRKQTTRKNNGFTGAVLVTGGAGFIGSNYLNFYVPKAAETLFINVDCLTYAGSLANLDPTVKKAPNYVFEKIDIRDPKKLAKVFKKYRPTSVIHFAAESHVDFSLINPSLFIETNVSGTNNLLMLAKNHAVRRFVQVSTDEVYGSSGEDGRPFTETDSLRPSNPYSASKAAAEMLALSYFRTFGLDVVVSRSSNNYGPGQDVSKIIPKFIAKLLKGEKVPLYSRGEHRRNWLHVLDNIRAIEAVFRNGRAGEIYNVGGDFEPTNFELTNKLIELCGRDRSAIDYVADRPGHDFRYNLDSTKIKSELGWRPEVSFEFGIADVVKHLKKSLAK
jgi:dTDP-glucose 4,6-dehydratase